MAWSTPFAFILVVLVVEIHLLVFLRLVTIPVASGDFLQYQWILDLWTAGGALDRGLPFELMKMNTVLAVYAWLMSRSMHLRGETVHRLALLGAALALLGFQVVLAMSSELVRPPFTLVPLDS